jgi:hypothetical protein
MDTLWLLVGLGIVAALAALWWRPMRRFGQQVHVERATEAFRLQRQRLEATFVAAARATGKPRGLSWKHCQFDDGVTFVRDKQTREIAALVGVSVHFEAIQDSNMEDNPNVGYPRTASAVFFFQHGQWNTVGKAVFNMNPGEALEYFKNQYEPAGSAAT